MQISSRRMNKTIEGEIRKMFYQLLCDLEEQEEVKTLLDDLLTEAETVAIVKRLAIAVYLEKGRSYENIKNNLMVSSATIATVAEQMGDPGIQLALRKIKADQWAEGASQKISGIMKKITGK